MTDFPRSTDIRLAFRSGDFAARQALAAVLTGLQPLGLSIEEAGTIELVLAEVLNNIVEHAYGTATPGRIELTCAHRADGLHVCIVDYGRSMPDGQVPIGDAAALDGPLQDMPEGGFGWFLIRDLAHDVVYRHDNGRNTLTLRIAIAQQPPVVI